ncbi:hypothetical protein [Nostoc sp. MS1]|uniref:hypothetical protein n=1 Tax=Nostoc sp. MS1 TaxID=2764711 RepID=UPI001CC6D5B3|nr:hypothetical protein [Nostoc sp. MS1]BCL39599.1 hypothetical protein NSMS1_60460 [Nostoc sp. MS1]
MSLPNSYNILIPQKRLSQLIAQSWLDGKKIPLEDKSFLIEQKILSLEEAEVFRIILVETSQIEIDEVDKKIIMPSYRPDQEVLEDPDIREWLYNWVASNPKNSPWIAPPPPKSGVNIEQPGKGVIFDTANEEKLLNENDSKIKTLQVPLLPNVKVFQGANANIAPFEETTRDDKDAIEVEIEPFNTLIPNKRLSQLIAKSWLENREISIDKNFLVNNGLISEFEAQFKIDIHVERNQPPREYKGGITPQQFGYKINVPYPPKPSSENLPENILREWVENDFNSAPWTPTNEWIPYTC